jgi:hypothetical protein
MLSLIKEFLLLIRGFIEKIRGNDIKEKLKNLDWNYKLQFYVGYSMGYLTAGIKNISENLGAHHKVKKFKYEVIKLVIAKLDKENLSFPDKAIENVAINIFINIGEEMEEFNTNEILATPEAAANRIIWKLKSEY